MCDGGCGTDWLGREISCAVNPMNTNTPSILITSILIILSILVGFSILYRLIKKEEEY